MRQGLNCTLQYAAGRQARRYRVRCSEVVHGFEMIADESEARRTRAYYPHRTAPTQFAIMIDLIGRLERDSLNNYLMRYVEYILDPGLKGSTPQMTVTVPSRNFTRVGVPLAGLEFGTRLGEMLWRPRIIFETSGEPIDWDQAYRISSVFANGARRNSPATEFFYPTGTQLGGEESPLAPQDLGDVLDDFNFF